MTKRIDGLIPTGKFKRIKGPAKELKTYTREPLKVTKGELDYLGGTIEDGMFRILPTCDHNKLLLQANFWLANGSHYKARQTLKGLGMRAKSIKTYIDEEVRLQKKYPSKSMANFYRNIEVLPSEYIVRSN
jgi:hypothetical protein